MAGTLALMLADYLRDRHSTCTLHCGDTLCLIACPICCERETRRDTYAYIQITDWVSCMAYPFSLLRLLFCIEVGLIVIYTQYTKHWWNLPFLFFQILFKFFTKFHDFCSLLQISPKMFLSSTFYINIQLIIEHGRLQKNKILNIF